MQMTGRIRWEEKFAKVKLRETVLGTSTGG